MADGRLGAELQAVLTDVRAMMIERDAANRMLADYIAGKNIHLSHIRAAERKAALLCAANHTRAKALAWLASGETLSFAAQLEGELRLRAENEGATAPTVKESETVRPCRCDRDDNGTWRGKCTCAQPSDDKAKRLGWLEAANYLDTCGHSAHARALRREAGVVDGE